MASADVNKFIDSLGQDILSFEFSSDVFDKITEAYVKRLRNNLISDKHNASKNLYQSLGHDANNPGESGWYIKVLGNTMKITLTLPEYYEYTDTGRSPTKSDGSGALKKNLEGITGWIAHKGATLKLPTHYKRSWKLKDGTVKSKLVPYESKADANKALAYMIARKIHLKGFKGTNWFSREETTFRKELETKLSEILGANLKFDLQIIKQL